MYKYRLGDGEADGLHLLAFHYTDCIFKSFSKKKNQKGFLWIKISQGTQILCLDHYIGFLNSQKGPENVKKGYKFG